MWELIVASVIVVFLLCVIGYAINTFRQPEYEDDD